MTGWIPADEETKYGVVIYNFWQAGAHKLKLDVGDSVHILRINVDWYYGYNTRNRQLKGIFPKNYIILRDALVTHHGSYETVAPKEPPMVQEITSVLREWRSIWERLYIYASRSELQGFDLEGRRKSSNRQELSDFEVVWKMMRELIDWRRLIMSRKLTNDEMRELQQKVTNKIDMGNALLGLDLVVRDEQGNILEPTQTSTISLFRQAEKTYASLWKQGVRKLQHRHLIKHLIATQRIQEEKESMYDSRSARKTTTFNLYVNIKNFVCRIGEDADVLMTLYDVKQAQFISENYLIQWGSKGMPRDIEMFNNIRVLFTDLGIRDAAREKISLVCQIIRIGRMDLKDSDTKKQTHGIRRPFGVAAIDVSDIVKGNIEPDEEKQFFVPFIQCGERDFLDNVVKKVVMAKEVNHKGQGLWVSLKKLYGDIKQVQTEYPHLVSASTAIARKMGFPDVIMPVDVRNDIYITINHGEFKKGTKTSEKNVEVTMGVCNHKGAFISDVISEGAGGAMLSHYKSVIYYHEDKPKWYETVKVAIPIDEFYGSHLKFTFKHRSSSDAKDKSEKPFAMSFVKLMQDNGTTLRDTVHDLLVYKLDGKRVEEASQYQYLKLPSTRQDFEQKANPDGLINRFQIQAGALSLNSTDNFQISTLVCSTKLTHNVDLMGLLKWRDNPGGLKDHLVSFMKVDGEEVVKFLQDTLDALFNILMQNSDSDLYDNLVFDALIFLISLISDRKYHQFRPVLDVYIKENFSATLAYNKLMVVLKYYIENVRDPSMHEKLLNALKSLEYIFKFIIRSRILFAALNEGRGKQQFEVSLKQLFNSINDLMRDTTDATLLQQGAVLKFLPSTIADVMTVFDPQELSLMLVEFINNLSRVRLTKQKMGCIHDIVHSAIFQRPECRELMLPMILCHLQQLLEMKEELELVIQILSDILMLLHRQDVGPKGKDIGVIAYCILRTVIQTVINMDRKSPHIGNCVAVMTAILRQMTEYHYMQYLQGFPNLIDLIDFLMEILMVFRDLLSVNVYPSDWNEMIMLQNSVFLTALRYFSHTIKEKFCNPFEQQLWNNFFHCAISFLTQAPLQLGNFSSAKRLKIIQKYKDMRREMGFEIRAMWYNLGQHKISFIPEMVGPFLEMTLIPETELRRATVPIFFDMMQCEFVSSPLGVHNRQPKRTFHMFENEIITQLDALIEGGRGDEQYKDLFYTIMYGLCEGHATMRKEGLLFVQTVQELLQHLLEYRTIIHDENKENRMSCTVNLLNFYHNINRQEMYVRYLHKLCDLHLECNNYTEAAYTLMLYANLLRWSDEPLPTILQSDQYQSSETHRELKEALYYTIIHYFDKGKMWEKGIELCKELANQYESETFNYSQLSTILKTQADFYDRIMKQMRPESEYFRVGYYGLGFQTFLRNKVFIYRGKEYERLSDFNARLQNQFPSAQLLKTLSLPTDDIKNSPQQFLQINALTPMLEPKILFVNKKVHSQILKYYKVNEVQRFTYSKRVNEMNSDVTTMWLERTNLKTAHPLPGILRWFPVVTSNTFEVSPLETAIETMESTNQKLKVLIEQHKADPNLRVDPVGMVLNGVVDAAVSGGIANYKVFYDDEYLKTHTTEKDEQLVKRLRQVTTLQMVLLQTTLDMHGKKAPESLQPFHAHLEKRFAQMKGFVEREYSIKTVTPTSPITLHELVTDVQCGSPPELPDRSPFTRVTNGSIAQVEELTEDLRKTLITRHTTAPPKRVQTMPPSSTEFTMDIPENGQSPSRSHGSPSKVQSAVRMVQSQVLRSNSTSSRESPSKTFSKASSTNSSPRNSQDNGIPESKPIVRSGSIVIELSEPLTPMRPRRPESNRRSRPISGQFALAGTTLSIASTNSSSSEAPPRQTIRPARPPPRKGVRSEGVGAEEPPPLPEKTAYADYGNTVDNDIISNRQIVARSVSHKDKPQPPLPAVREGADPPIVPPKKPLRLVPNPDQESLEEL